MDGSHQATSFSTRLIAMRATDGVTQPLCASWGWIFSTNEWGAFLDTQSTARFATPTSLATLPSSHRSPATVIDPMTGEHSRFSKSGHVTV